jgi:apolipoprotein N-acyltransferase
VVCALGVGAMLVACFPPFGLPVLLPFALAVLLALLSGVTVREGAYIGLACGLVFFGGTLAWLANLFGAAAVSLWAIAAAYILLFSVLFVWLRRRLPRMPVWLLAALVWTGIEYLRSEPMWLNFAWMGLGYAVVNAPILASGAAWFGSYGLTFALVAFGALLGRQISAARAWRCAERNRPALYVGGMLLVWLLLLFLPCPVPTPDHPLSVRLVQANSEDEENLFGLSQPIAGRAWDVIVWPEYSFDRDPRRDPRLWSKLAGVAQANHAYLIFGGKDQFDLGDEAGFRNTAFLLAPDGRLVGTHVKNHPVHLVRDGVAGTRAQALLTTLGRLGVAICFDMDFPDVARRLAADGAEVFLVPSDNPAEWGPMQRVQHRQMFQMRAIECGRWLATADVAGSTFVVAPTGRILQSVRTTAPTALDTRIGRRTGQTLYVRGGWRFGALCLWGLIALCLRAIRS